MNADQKHWVVDPIVASVVKAIQGIGDIYDDDTSTYMPSSMEPLFYLDGQQQRALSQSWCKISTKVEMPKATR